MFHHARLLDGEIKKGGAKTVFFMTWANREKPETQAILAEGRVLVLLPSTALVVADEYRVQVAAEQWPSVKRNPSAARRSMFGVWILPSP